MAKQTVAAHSTPIDRAIAEVERLRRVLNKGTSAQVNAAAERDLVQATAYAWFQTHRPEVSGDPQHPECAPVDARYQGLLQASGRATTRARYKALLRDLRKDLVALRSRAIQTPDLFQQQPSVHRAPPDFKPLVPDDRMRAILERRWRETSLCLDAGAHLAATVMMGALLEALLLSRVNHLSDLGPVFKCKGAPKGRNGKTLQLKEWTLRHYIDVAHDMGWIRQAARDVGVVIRDYRNYIHPAKELSHGVTIEQSDTAVLWSVFTSIADQVIRSVEE